MKNKLSTSYRQITNVHSVVSKKAPDTSVAGNKRKRKRILLTRMASIGLLVWLAVISLDSLGPFVSGFWQAYAPLSKNTQSIAHAVVTKPIMLDATEPGEIDDRVKISELPILKDAKLTEQAQRLQALRMHNVLRNIATNKGDNNFLQKPINAPRQSLPSAQQAVITPMQAGAMNQKRLVSQWEEAFVGQADVR